MSYHESWCIPGFGVITTVRFRGLSKETTRRIVLHRPQQNTPCGAETDDSDAGCAYLFHTQPFPAAPSPFSLPSFSSSLLVLPLCPPPPLGTPRRPQPRRLPPTRYATGVSPPSAQASAPLLRQRAVRLLVASPPVRPATSTMHRGPLTSADRPPALQYPASYKSIPPPPAMHVRPVGFLPGATSCTDAS